MKLLLKGLILTFIYFFVHACSTAKKDSGGGGAMVPVVSSSPNPSNSIDVNPSTVPASTGINPSPETTTSSTSSPQGFNGIKTGCVQGVILNGYTGARIDMNDIKDPSGVFVLIHGKKIKAEFIPGDTNLVGEYSICGIPVEETYPLFVYREGFLPFETSVFVDSTRPLRLPTHLTSANVNQEQEIPLPTVISNIVLFPFGESRDLVVKVVSEGKTIEKAKVDLEPIAGGNHFAFEGVFANTANTRLLPIRVETDNKGLATFPKAQLSLGHRYRVSAIPPLDFDKTVSGNYEITLGVSGASVSDTYYEVTIDLDLARQALSIVSCSNNKGQSVDKNGQIVIEFNRDIFVKDPDSWEAVASWSPVPAPASTTKLPAKVAKNNKSESVNATATGSTLVLLPIVNAGEKWRDELDMTLDPTSNANMDRNLSIDYKAATIKIGVEGDNSRVLKTLDTITGFDQCGDKTAKLISVRIYDRID